MNVYRLLDSGSDVCECCYNTYSRCKVDHKVDHRVDHKAGHKGLIAAINYVYSAPCRSQIWKIKQDMTVKCRTYCTVLEAGFMNHLVRFTQLGITYLQQIQLSVLA